MLLAAHKSTRPHALLRRFSPTVFGAQERWFRVLHIDDKNLMYSTTPWVRNRLLAKKGKKPLAAQVKS